MSEQDPTAEAAIDPKWNAAFEWVEKNVGRVVRREPHERWRDAWYIDAEGPDGTRVPLYFRGDRGESDHGVYPLEHEMQILQILEREGIPVPHVHGFCPEPRGIVMECVPGRANLATARDDAEREAVLDQYMETLARMHALDTAPFEAMGLPKPQGSQALGLGDFDPWEQAFRKSKCRPEPLIEFGIRWVRRNAPEGRERVSLLHCDAGQFLFDEGKLTAVIDLELAYLGDPAADIAGMLCRDLSEPLGDIARGLERYEAAGGERVDPRVVYYHTIRFGLVTPITCAPLVAKPPAGLNYMQYLAWHLVYGRIPMELIALLTDTEVEAPPLPEPAPTEASPAYDALISLLGGDAAPETLEYDTDTARRIALYLQRADLYGAELEAQDLDEVGELLGSRPRDRVSADLALEAFIAEAGAERDGEIARYFCRRMMRQESLAQPALRELENAQVQRID